MRCPFCGAASIVLDTRHLVRRRRECFNGHRFFTTEVLIRTPAKSPAPPVPPVTTEKEPTA